MCELNLIFWLCFGFLVNGAKAAPPRFTRKQLKIQMKKNRADQMKLVKKCTVNLKRIPPNELAQYMNDVVHINVPVRQPAKRNKRVKSCIESSSHQHQIARENIKTTKKSVRFVSTVNEHSIDSQPSQSDALTANNNNVRFPVAESVQSTKNHAPLIDVPVHHPMKRNKRAMSCIDSFAFEERDDFQTKDSNPVMQPSSTQHQIVHEIINTTENSVHVNSTMNEQCLGPEKKRIEAVATCSESAMNGQNEHLLVEGPVESTDVKIQCDQCFIYKQNITQLKKRIKNMKDDTLAHMNQFDSLQDRCTQLIQKNKTLEEELVKYRAM